MGIEQETRPIFATQGGGYAVYEGGRYVWHSEIPAFVNAVVGDPIPEEWGVVAVNKAAIDEAEERATSGDIHSLGLEMSAHDE